MNLRPCGLDWATRVRNFYRIIALFIALLISMSNDKRDNTSFLGQGLKIINTIDYQQRDFALMVAFYPVPVKLSG